AALGGSIMVAALLGSLPLEAAAADLRQGSDVTIGPGETVNDDVYAGAGTISVSGTVNGSVIAAGGTITVSGNVARDLIIGGGTITVTGRVAGSIIAAGGNITVNGPVAQDIVVTGGMIDIGSSATIGRDLVVAGGTATVSAPIARRVRMSSGSLTLRNRVGGDVRGRVDHLKLDGAQVGGNLDYTSNTSAELLNGARVAGTTTRHTPTDRGGDAGNGFLGWLRGLIGIFALGLLLIFLLPGFSSRAIDTERAEPWASLGIGAAILVITPIVALIVFIIGIFIGGWWLGLLLVPLWILALAIGFAISGFLLGRLIFARLGWGRYHDALALLGGLFVLTVVGLIPVIGWLVGLAAVVLGLGALALVVSRRASMRPAGPGDLTGGRRVAGSAP
ncbi:MAG: FapA family protein, partial [Candidatus Dormibacteraeota bacterium]|nr:FapA family protein [Candidatus Dormibacteraeota bacterium]